MLSPSTPSAPSRSCGTIRSVGDAAEPRFRESGCGGTDQQRSAAIGNDVAIREPFAPEILGAWGEVELLRPATGGTRNTVWFALVNGERCVLRRSARSPAALEWELRAVEAVRSNGLGTPGILRTRSGAPVHGDVVIHEYIEGHPPEGQDDWSAVARYLEAMHAAFSDVDQRPGFVSALDLLSIDEGGDVDLMAMPSEAVDRCRAAWARLAAYPVALVHGDPGERNILVTDVGVVLIDWDESRVDVPLLDLAALPTDVAPMAEHERWLATQAASAWEAAVSWRAEPEYARRRLAEVET